MALAAIVEQLAKSVTSVAARTDLHSLKVALGEEAPHHGEGRRIAAAAG